MLGAGPGFCDRVMMDRVAEMLEELAVAARGVIARGGDRRFDNKAAVGLDPVTQVDRDIETALRAMIAAEFPDDAIIGEEFGNGEEFGDSGAGAARRWSIDPIDGTRAFICGLPSWAVLVGVIEDEAHVAGLIDLPALDETLIASGGVTRRNGSPVSTSGCATLAAARMATTDPYLFEGGERDLFERVRRASLLVRYGLDALGYARVATGDVDLVIESGLKRHDLDALVAVVRGAGGTIGDWDGGEDWDGGRIIAAASEALYAEVVALLAA